MNLLEEKLKELSKVSEELCSTAGGWCKANQDSKFEHKIANLIEALRKSVRHRNDYMDDELKREGVRDECDAELLAILTGEVNDD